MSNARKISAVALLAALAWAVAPVAEAQRPIRIGASLPLTGSYAAQGQTHHQGYQLCVKHTNDKGGVLGRPLELLVRDDGSDLATAVRLYEQLITRDKVDLVLGPYSGPIADAVAEVTEKHRLPMETYAEALSALAADAVISGPLGARLSQAVRLRNILVHGYLDIDHWRLFDELDWIESTEEFAATIERWLDQNVDH